jgi:aminopeptidase N
VALWEDIWLHEGFATYAELIWSEHLHGNDVYREFVAERYAAVELAEYPPPGDPPSDALFNGGVYQRGALTLHALRQEVGDAAFFAILRTFATRFAYGNATTAEFISVAEELSGLDLDDLFDAWLYEPELPPLP